MQDHETQERSREERAEEVREHFPKLKLLEDTEGFEMVSDAPLREESEMDDLIPSSRLQVPFPVKPRRRWA